MATLVRGGGSLVTGSRVRRAPAKPRGELAPLGAGRFSAWLAEFREALSTGAATRVECGDCSGCCTASHFVLVEPSERGPLDRLHPGLLVQAPGMPEGTGLIPYGSRGRCPLLQDGKCSIYAIRPRACRAFDCRVLPAAGLTADAPGQKTIRDTASRWIFDFPGDLDRTEHRAVVDAAEFIEANAELFPGARIPSRPEQLAVLAIKTYGVFLPDQPRRTPQGLAEAVVKAARSFDAPT